jgi:hypothetical protein
VTITGLYFLTSQVVMMSIEVMQYCVIVVVMTSIVMHASNYSVVDTAMQTCTLYLQDALAISGCDRKLLIA